MRDRAREEGQQETNALRVYLGNVEAAAASLVTRIQELQHLLALCEMCLHFTAQLRWVSVEHIIFFCIAAS